MGNAGHGEAVHRIQWTDPSARQNGEHARKRNRKAHVSTAHKVLLGVPLNQNSERKTKKAKATIARRKSKLKKLNTMTKGLMKGVVSLKKVMGVEPKQHTKALAIKLSDVNAAPNDKH